MSQANTILTEEERSLVNDCAARLRVIQGDAAAMAADKRREYLGEEVHRSFKGLTPARRRSCLDSLLTRFPVGGKLAGTLAAPPAAAPAVPVVESPEKLLEALLARVGELSAEQRAAFGRRLAEAGLNDGPRAALAPEIVRELQTRFGLPPDRPPDLERVAQLTALAVQSLADLDRAAVNVLKELYPRSPVLNRAADFRRAAGQYLAGDLEAIEPHARLTSALLGTLLAALLGGGRDFGRQFIEKFSPNAVEEVVISEGRSGILGPNKKERCWDKYCTLSRDIATPELLDRWLKDCLGRFADSGIKNIR
jgi:hypothetical protein